MIRRLTFGQYKNKGSVIHSLDARTKIICVIILSILLFAAKAKFEILIFSSFVFFVFILSKMMLYDLVKNLRPFYFIFIFLLLMYVIFSRNQLLLGVTYLWRYSMLLIITLILTYTTTIPELIKAIENLLKPLKPLKVEPRNIAVALSVAVRFMPVLFIRLEKTREAMLSRLANFRKIMHIKMLVVILLEKMLKSASSLSDAMYARIYNENVETKRLMRFKKNDYISILIVVLLAFIIY